jgi:hypothetical protein
MKYENKDNYTIIKTYYKEEKKYFDILIDTEDLEKVKDKKIYMFLDNGICKPRIYNGKYYMTLQSFLTPNLKISYCKNRNYYDCRKENITSSPSEVDGLIEMKSLRIKEGSLRMSKESRDNITRGMRENRYTKDYSIKLQEDKLGEKNLSAVLTWNLVNVIRETARNHNISQYELADTFNVGRATIADIINYRTWTINPELNERIYKDSNIKIVNNTKQIDINIEFTYDEIPFNNILLKFEDEFLYIEKLSIEGLVYIEQRSIEGKCLASLDIYIPKDKTNFRKTFYSIAKMNPRSKGREYFYNITNKAFREVKRIIINS